VHVQMPLPGFDPDLTPFDDELLAAIRANAGADGSTRSLFDVSVRRAGLHYGWARDRLRVLELLGYVEVDHSQARHGGPLILRLTK